MKNKNTWYSVCEYHYLLFDILANIGFKVTKVGIKSSNLLFIICILLLFKWESAFENTSGLGLFSAVFTTRCH